MFGMEVGGRFDMIKGKETDKIGWGQGDGSVWRESNWNWEHLQGIHLHAVPRLKHLHFRSSLLTSPFPLASPQIGSIPHFPSIPRPTSSPRIP